MSWAASVRSSTAAGGNARLAAVRAVVDVLGAGRSLGDALPARLEPLAAARRPFAQELAFGTLRWHRRLDALAEHLLARGLRRRDLDVRAALLVGLYQLLHTEVPAHAAVSEAVALARVLGKPWAAKLLNANLRRAQREAATLLRAVDAEPARRHALPQWLWNHFGADWPTAREAIAAGGNARAPMTLRVNALRTPRQSYQQRLATCGITARCVPGVRSALTLAKPVAVSALPGFAGGQVSVQDAAAQLAAPLLAPRSGEHVLDACAAPGGKTGHLMEIEPGAHLTALELDAARAERLRANLERLDAPASVHLGDAAVPDTWWDGHPFDAVLLDAPCTGTGVIRRHPDIKCLRRERDVAATAAAQRRLLAALWPLLRRGGRLVYCTCSVLRAENAAVIEAFLAEFPDARAHRPGLPVGRADGPGWQIFPGEGEMDGFFYASLSKR